MSNEPSELGVVLARLREKAGLSRRQLEECSGVDEETIKTIETRAGRQTMPRTLQRLAEGLATNRALGRLDPEAAEEIRLRLLRAAGYVPPAPPPSVAPDIEAALRALFPPDRAPLIADILQVWAGLGEPQQRYLLETMRAAVLGLPTETGAASTV